MRRVPLLLAPLLLAAQCGPTREEVGAAVLLAAPVALLVRAGIVRGLTALFRPLHPAAPRLRPVVSALGIWVGLAALVALPVSLHSDAAEWFPAALMTYGATVAALTLLVWRIWLAVRPESAFHGALLWPHALITLPAVPLALMGPEGPAGDPVTQVLVMGWVTGGYLGIPGGVLLLAFLGEGIARRLTRQ